MKPIPILGVSQRTPPHHHRAEQALLGALLTNNRAYETVAEFLRAEHFVDPVHQRVYGAIVRLIDQGRLADALSVKQDFEGNNILDEVGGTAYLAELVTAMVGILPAAEYGRAIHDAWMRRELIDIGEDAVNRAFGAESGQSAADVAEVMDQRLMALSAGVGSQEAPVPLSDAVGGAVRIAEAAAKRGTGLAGISTGYEQLDGITKGLMPSDLVLIGARPAMGKTALGMSIAVRCAAAGAKVLYWCGEMTADQLAARVAAAGARLPTTAVFSGRTVAGREEENAGEARELSAAEWHRLAMVQAAVARMPLLLDCRPGVTVSGLRARARRLARTSGLDLLVIDYVQLMRPSAALAQRSRYEQITEISGDLLALAKELGIPLIALAQINRENEKRVNKRPTKADLRDSGALEQDATRILFLHRPHYYLVQSGPPEKGPKDRDEQFQSELAAYHDELRKWDGVAQIIVDKNRHGPTDTRHLRFQAETTWFFDRDEPADAPAWSGLWGG